MAPSLPKKSIKKATTATAVAPSPFLASVNRLASVLPPSAASSADLNPLADLITLFTDLPIQFSEKTTLTILESNRQNVFTSLHLLKNIFIALINSGRLNGNLKSNKKLKITESAEPDSTEAVKTWLNGRYHDFIAKSVEFSSNHWDTGIRTSTLNVLMSLLRTESQFLTSLHPNRSAQFATKTFTLIVEGLLVPTGTEQELKEDIKEEWKKWFDKCDDIRYYFLQQAAALISSYTTNLSKSLPPNLAGNLLSILETLATMPTASSELNEWFCTKPIALKSLPISAKGTGTGPPAKKRKAEEVIDTSTGIFDSSEEEEDERPAKKLSAKDSKKLSPPLLSLSAHKKVFQDCWLGLLSLPLNEGEGKRILVILHRQVLPNMSDAKRVMDWLVDCADVGGTVGILALNGLFTLMVKHNLEYPDFFTKLYSLLDRDVLHVRYRPRFFRLLEIFMGSSHLPSTLIASFIKRLARLSLSAPPAGIVTIIPFIYNLLKLHPSCMMMIHRPTGDDNDDIENDPFNAEEMEPTKTFAIESSLWELSTHRNHYSASVSGLAKIFEEVMNKQSYAMEDFLDHSYGTMFETEATRKIRNAPALAPVPARQPIGDSFFPLPQKVVESTEAMEEEEDLLAPVDLISKMWTF